VLVKPIRSGLKTNLVITTSRRTYLLELTSTEKTWMASVSWDYPKDRMLALQRQAQAASAAAPVDTGLSLEKIRFRYAVSGSNPPWKPLRAFDDGEKVYIQFPPGIAQGELPPLFVIGAQGDGQLVNYRFRSPYYIVDRLFGAAELRLGGDGGRRGADRAHRWRSAEELTMSQDDTPDLATPQAGKVAPEAVALRAQPRPVTRLNRRTLAILAGGLSVAVLGALMWSLQPQRRGANEQTELYNVDRVSKSEGLDGCRRTTRSCRRLPVPELGPPLPGDLGPAIVKSQQPVTAAYAAPGHDPNDACARKPKRRRLRRCSSARASAGQGRAGSADASRRLRRASPPMRRSTRWRPGRPRRRPSLPTRPPCRTGKTRKRLS
jgi:P-type conjugative transfer protein TrbG